MSIQSYSLHVNLRKHIRLLPFIVFLCFVGVLSTRYLLYKPHVKSVAGQYDINHIQIVYHVIRRNSDASMSDFVSAFNGILTQKQVRNLIEGLCKTPLIASHGNARATRYNWVDR